MIKVYPDLESLSQAAASLVVEQASQAVAARGRFCVALSGGGTPRRTYELLAASPFKEQAPWHRMHIFWGDERCVPLDDPRSNARMAKEAWLDHVPIPESQIHPMYCTGDAGGGGPAVRGAPAAILCGPPAPPGPGVIGVGRQRPHRLAVPGHAGAQGNRALGR